MVIEDVDKLKPSNTAGQNVKCSHFGKVWQFSITRF